MTRQYGFLPLGAALCLAAAVPARATEEPEADPAELPRIPAMALEDALATFEMREGFTLKLAAGEPEVTDPIAICFDADGRLFAVEMRDYPERRDESLGRIRMLQDTDDDGRFEKSTVFADGLKWPTSVTCYDGGAFVVVTPDILYFKDTDGDGIADTREIVFTGLADGVSTEKLNMEGLANGLQWGPDNRIWGTSSTSGGKLRRPGQAPGEAIDLAGQDFSFDPRTRELRAEHGGGQNGMGFDVYGRRFVCSNSRHLMAVLWEKAWLGSSTGSPLPPPLAGIAIDGDAAPVFRISPDEPWRIVRTRWRVAGVVGGPVEEGGRVSGYFTGASGVTIYTGDAYGVDFIGNAFIADVGSNLVHRKIVRPADGGKSVALEGVRPTDENDREFLASRDNWFRPTNFANAPDGCLYVVDMYREVVEHPWSLPEGIKKHLDLYAGMDRGRIYRVEPEGWQRRATPKLTALENDALAAMRDHPNGWHRETAQRLLFERGDVRAGSGWARPAEADSPFGLFREVLRASAGELASSPEWRRVEAIAASAGEQDPLLSAAVLRAVREPGQAESLWRSLRRDGMSRGAMLEGVLRWLGANSGDAMVAKVAEDARSVPARETGIREIGAFLDGRASRKRSKEPVREELETGGLLESARALALDRAADVADRLAALRVLGYVESRERLEDLLGEGQPEDVRRAALGVLGTAEDDGFPGVVIAAWGNLGVRSRVYALELLAAGEGHGALEFLEAVRAKAIDPDTFPSGSAEALRGHGNPDLARRAAEIFPEPVFESRDAAFARFRPSLELEGDAAKGAVKFEQLCAGCHRAGGKGIAAGPDMESVKGAGRESMLTNLIDPNRQVGPQFRTYTIALADGGSVAGIIAGETVEEVTVRQAFGVERTFPRKEVRAMESGGLSLMPVGLEAALTVEEMADLLAFIEGL